MKGRNLNKHIEWKFLRFKVVEVWILKWHKLKMYTFLFKKAFLEVKLYTCLLTTIIITTLYTTKKKKEYECLVQYLNIFDSNSKIYYDHQIQSTIFFHLVKALHFFPIKNCEVPSPAPGVIVTLRHIHCFICYAWLHIAWKSVTMQFNYQLNTSSHCYYKAVLY